MKIRVNHCVERILSTLIRISWIFSNAISALVLFQHNRCRREKRNPSSRGSVWLATRFKRLMIFVWSDGKDRTRREMNNTGAFTACLSSLMHRILSIDHSERVLTVNIKFQLWNANQGSLKTFVILIKYRNYCRRRKKVTSESQGL